MWGHTGRAVAEQLVGERLCDMGRRCVLQVEIEEDNTPPLSGGVDRRRFVIHRGHGQRAWSHCGHGRCASYCSHGHLRIEPELQKEPGQQGKLLRVRGSRITSGRLRGNTRGNGATKEKILSSG